MVKIVENHTNKIIIALIVVMLCNFIMPNFVFATDDEENPEGGVIFKYLIPVLLMAPDLLVQKLQQILRDDR